MADISTFPTIRKVLVSGDNIKSRKSVGGAIKAGMIVCPAATGVEGEMIAYIAGDGTLPEGVALYDAADGAMFAMAADGCEVYVANNQGISLTADVGDLCIGDDNAVGGCASPVVPTTAGINAATPLKGIGRFVSDMAANGTGIIKIQPFLEGFHA